MDKNAELYADIFNTVIFDAAFPIERVDPMTSVSIAAGSFKGFDVPVNTVVIENDGIVSISVQFKEGQHGYETQLLTWAADEEFVRRVAEHAFSLIMEWNQWESQESLVS